MIVLILPLKSKKLSDSSMYSKITAKFLLFSLFIVLVLSCNNKRTSTTRAFYYWKTELEFNNPDDSLLCELQVKDLFVKYFDVDWSPNYKMPVPLGILRPYWWGMEELSNIIPCIYITNDVFKKCNKQELDTLVSKIYRKINFINSDYYQFFALKIQDSIEKANTRLIESLKKQNYNSWEIDDILKFDEVSESERKKIHEPIEIQIDCDWTASTKENYFYFLKACKNKFKNTRISCTLRLWQYKYRKAAGIPPVDRCMLMCYNVNSPKNYETQNSIAEFEEIKKYFQEYDYPIKLDIALPVFCWGVLFKNHQFNGIIGNIAKEEMEKDTAIYKKISENKYMFKVDTVIGNTYIRCGDELKIEQVSDNELEKIAHFIDNNIKLDNTSRITFFSWDINYLNNYGLQNMEKYYNIFKH
jgi:hypothetical protein